jgi:hypothetical protein
MLILWLIEYLEGHLIDKQRISELRELVKGAEND